MPASRRYQRPTNDIWPGFVDALSTLLLVFIFLLVVFVLGQFFLSGLLEGRDEAVGRLESELTDLQDRLTVERTANTDLRTRLSTLGNDLRATITDRDDLEAELTEVRTDRELLDQRVAALTEQRDEVADDVETLSSQREALARQLEQMARATLDLESSVETESREKQVAFEQVQLLQERIQALSLQLIELDTTLATKQQQIEVQNTVIDDLGTRLNLALADQVEELSRYRSDFFGRLRQVLGTQENVEVVGDRFVLQSEVLFESGQAEIGAPGREQLSKLAATFRSIIEDIPTELPWVLQVDGHTDRRPINTPEFPSNWELSTARAIEVARFLVSEGIPPERIAARGFAEFQPLDPSDTIDAYERNRRIELKLTTR